MHNVVLWEIFDEMANTSSGFNNTWTLKNKSEVDCLIDGNGLNNSQQNKNKPLQFP